MSASAVKLGYLTKEQAEYELNRWKVRGIDRDDELHSKAFRAGFLWGVWKMGWAMTDEDVQAAEDAFHEWCTHLEKKAQI